MEPMILEVYTSTYQLHPTLNIIKLLPRAVNIQLEIHFDCSQFQYKTPWQHEDEHCGSYRIIGYQYHISTHLERVY